MLQARMINFWYVLNRPLSWVLERSCSRNSLHLSPLLSTRLSALSITNHLFNVFSFEDLTVSDGKVHHLLSMLSYRPLTTKLLGEFEI